MRNERNSFRFVILTFVVIIISLLIGLLISRGIKNNRQNKFAEQMSKLSEDLSETDTASTQIGKTIEQVEEEEDPNGFEVPIATEVESDSNKSSKPKSSENGALKDNNKKEKKNDNKKEKENDNKNEKVEDEEKNNIVETNSENIEKTLENEKKIELDAPIKGEILREFAKDSLVFSNTLQEWVTHNGVDIKADKTSVVKSAANGTVSAIKNDPRYGLTVIINHDNGYQTIYSNLLTAEFVVKGEKVEIGQSIGTVGNSASFEIEDEYHLHFELLKDNQYLDPTQYMNF